MVSVLNLDLVSFLNNLYVCSCCCNSYICENGRHSVARSSHVKRGVRVGQSPAFHG